MSRAKRSELDLRELVRLALSLSLCLAGGESAFSHSAPEKQPNVVFFLADDLGIRDLGCYGSSFYETPNIDRLAKEGTLFTNAYSACPVCSPTRAAIQTGRWPQRCGITDYLDAPTPSDPWRMNTRGRSADFAKKLELSEFTLGDAFKSKGYATFFAGKWHLGPEGCWPENQGYDVNRGGVEWGGPYGGDKYFSPFANPRLTDGPRGEHLADRLARETADFIEANRSRPFFAMYAFYDVHTPLMAREDLRAKYEAKRARLNLAVQWAADSPRRSRITQDHVVYAAMVEAMDQAVGKVLAKIDEAGLSKNTIVVFTSDNGGLSTYHQTYSSPQWAPTSNAPYRAGKGWMYDGGIRVPLIYRWPSVIKSGATTQAVSSSPDHLPTLMELCKIKTPKGLRLDGASLVKAMKGGTMKDRPIYWHYPHFWSSSLTPASALRFGDWKLIQWLEEGRVELYNLKSDLSETKDLSLVETKKTKSLLAMLDLWRREVGAKPLIPNPAFDGAKGVGEVIPERPR